MAYLKIHPIKVTDDKALAYITDADKTDGKVLISSFACSPESASIEFAITREAGKNNVMEKGNNLAFHLIQSFKPGETDAETAHRIGKQLVDEVLRGKYEYVISTHIDRMHVCLTINKQGLQFTHRTSKIQKHCKMWWCCKEA